MKTEPAPEFGGAKAVLICGDKIVVLRRDDIARIPFPNRIDFPGGGREGDESPEVCAARETHEEVGLQIDPARFEWSLARQTEAGTTIYLLAAPISTEEAASIVIGDEGQATWMMPIAEYLKNAEAIPHLQTGLAIYLRDQLED